MQQVRSRTSRQSHRNAVVIQSVDHTLPRPAGQNEREADNTRYVDITDAPHKGYGILYNSKIVKI